MVTVDKPLPVWGKTKKLACNKGIMTPGSQRALGNRKGGCQHPRTLDSQLDGNASHENYDLDGAGLRRLPLVKEDTSRILAPSLNKTFTSIKKQSWVKAREITNLAPRHFTNKHFYTSR